MRSRGLLLPVAALVLAGCGLVPKSVEVLGVHASQDGLGLEIVVASCNAELSFEIQESETSVAVWVQARGGIDADCADGLTVELERPLGGRIFIDGFDFTEVEVSRG